MTANPARGVRIDRRGPLRRTAAGRIAIPLAVGRNGDRIGEGDLVLTHDAAEWLHNELGQLLIESSAPPPRTPKGPAMADATLTPRRTAQDLIRRSSLAEAASAFDGSVPLDWVRNTGTSPTAALAAWSLGNLAELPAGKAWDVIRLPRPIGWESVARMRAAEVTVGPAQLTPDHVELLVPVGSAARWDVPGSTVLTEGDSILVPHPVIIAPRTQMGHSWFVPPRECAPLTDADVLREAYAAALAALRMDEDAR